MMIKDEELRSQYKTTSEERLHKLEDGLLNLEQQVNDQVVLATLLQEIRSLKGDSQKLALEAITALTQQVEDILENLQRQEIPLTLEVSDRLHFGLNAISQLVYEAVMGEPARVDINQALEHLREAILVATGSASAIAPELTMLLQPKSTLIPDQDPAISDQGIFPPDQDTSIPGQDIPIPDQGPPIPDQDPQMPDQGILMPDQDPPIPDLDTPIPDQGIFLPDQDPPISDQDPQMPDQDTPIPRQDRLNLDQDTEDEKIRKIYKKTNKRRLQKLESGLLHLATSAADDIVLREILPEIQKLQTESRQAGLEPMVALTQQFETALKGAQHQGFVLSIELCAHLYEALKAMEEWVNSAAPDEPDEPDQPDQDVPQPSSDLLMTAGAEPSVPSLVSKLDGLIPSVPPISADAELREIYKTISAGRLQKLETGLAQLKKQPDDTAIMAELLREAHSFKGDSRSVGVHTVEILTHTFEDILVGIQDQKIELTPALSNSLYLGLDAIAQLVNEAISHSPSSSDSAEEFHPLSSAVPVSTAAAKQLAAPLSAETIPPQSPPPNLEVDTPHRIDTISIQASDLDTLMIPVEELTVARIQIAQATAQLEQIAVLLEKERTNRNQAPSSIVFSPNPHQEQLENLIATFRISAQSNSAKLGLIAEDLRDQIDALRLQPLSHIFQLFPRLVQDLAKQQSKQVEVRIEGGDTTVEKRIHEEVKDSLLHLVRNAIDHGVELPAERKSRNKPPTATIWLRGYQTDTGAVVEVTDDGRGLDIEQIKQTAIRRQLYRPDELAAMTSDQIQALILAPGFSTRTVITEMSGRGVGLDIVRTHSERLKGKIQIASTPGQGCTFRLQLNAVNSDHEDANSEMQDSCLAH